MTGAIATDLRRAPLTALRSVRFRSRDRDLWADEAAMYDRLLVTWAGLDDAAWHLPGAAPSDAGGPDWSLAEHVGHLAEWQEVAAGYTARAVATDEWPADADYEGGDFDRWNERHRAPWTTMPRDEILARFDASRRALLVEAHRLSEDRIRADEPWGWLYMAVHGHYLDHLGIIEAWTASLRVRQADGDPFIDDPRPADFAEFESRDAAIAAEFGQLIRTVPADRWETDELTPGWTLRDHVDHLSDWTAEGIRAMDVFDRRGHWLADPEEGIDAWNERMVQLGRGRSVADTLTRYDEKRTTMLSAVARLSTDDLRSPDGWSWTYDCLYGHTRKHLALVGTWCATEVWQREPD